MRSQWTEATTADDVRSAGRYRHRYDDSEGPRDVREYVRHIRVEVDGFLVIREWWYGKKAWNYELVSPASIEVALSHGGILIPQQGARTSVSGRMACSKHRYEDALRQFQRNGVWGTCSDCPDGTGATGSYRKAPIYPERCQFWNRPDHQIEGRPELEKAHGATRESLSGSLVISQEDWSSLIEKIDDLTNATQLIENAFPSSMTKAMENAVAARDALRREIWRLGLEMSGSPEGDHDG